MLIEIYVFWEVVVITLFLISFYTHQEILWGITLVLAGVLSFTSYNIEYYVYQFNATTSVYQAVAQNHSYGYLMAINLIFFVLALILLIFDLFDKYGGFISKKKRVEDEQ